MKNFNCIGKLTSAGKRKRRRRMILFAVALGGIIPGRWEIFGEKPDRVILGRLEIFDKRSGKNSRFLEWVI